MLLTCGAHSLDLTTPVVMGVVNVTPDSFSDGGRFLSPDEAIRHAQHMVAEGAAIIDVGGESTRPGAEPVETAEELDRVIPVIEALAAGLPVPVSVDTSKPEVMQAAIAAGASMVNDVLALQEPGALEAVAGSQVALCLMHMQGRPRTMQQAPRYDDVVRDVHHFLSERVRACEAIGIDRSRVVIDPGFGFGKTVDHNLALLASLDEFTREGLPVLVGLSRKSLIGQITGRAAGERLAGSVALAALAVGRGAAIVRAHDVAATVDAVRIAAAVRRWRAANEDQT
jgi:dihydropteroate synthase